MELQELHNQLEPIIKPLNGTNLHVMVLAFDADIDTGFSLIQGYSDLITALLVTAVSKEEAVRRIFLDAETIINEQLLSNFKSKNNG